jgi:uncharacterized protein YceH (UPF0502 family)
MTEQLDLTEVRIIGCLMEKAVTTPDQHPLTLNALTNACNQKSSREPVMNLSQGEVQRATRILKERHQVTIEEGARSSVEKYAQRFCNTLLGELKFDPAQYAIMCLLMLRGAQTPGELRSRSGRLHEFADNHQVVESLKSLIDRSGGGIVARLPKLSGRMDHQYMHLLTGDIESVIEEQETPQRIPSTNKDQQIKKLEARVDALEKALHALADSLGESVDLTSVSD